MPTARELLEQADALMRRNRSVRVDTEVAPSPPGHTDLGVPEPPATEALAAEPEPAVDTLPQQAASLEDIPVLTDAVEEIEAPTIQEAAFDGSDATDWGEFDIIEEIEAPSILDLPEDGGEPSGWGTYDNGEPTIGGTAPDSLIVVPPLTYFRDGDRRGGAEFGVRARAEAAAEADGEEPGASGVLVVDQSLVQARLLATEGAGEPLAAAVAHDAAAPDVAADEGIVTLYDVVSVDDGATVVAHAAAAGGEPSPVTRDEPTGLAPLPIEAAPMASIPDAATAGAAAIEPEVAPGAATPDRARWDALAEDIRMQVLQRIDMFTDAGMQDQLRARLQPIVDRASADLVDTINQHVGQLLRSYVAEAIEREIDKWRGAG
jgi:hypothetical protein